jgi:DNA-binding Lrp family transcriptional regulator
LKELKPIDYKLMFELIKDSHRSDRQLAKALGISQPTVTRRRTMLEKNYIDGYTIIPKFGQMGFELVAFTFVKSKLKDYKGSDVSSAIDRMKEWYMKKPNVLLTIGGRGLGYDLMIVSVHENYSDFAKFMRENESELSDLTIESQSFRADLTPGLVIKPFHLKYLAKLNNSPSPRDK